MNSDIRLSVSFRGHRKRKRLRLLLGPGFTDSLLDLWIATAMNHPNGILQGMDEIGSLSALLETMRPEE